jgi:tripartite-type tricarboxylate transporter receptor subunit TctC
MKDPVYSRRTVGALMLASVASTAFGETLRARTAAQGKQGTAAAGASPSAPWPTKPVRLLLGFPPGSVFDIAARVLAEPLSAVLGQPVIVDYKPGAGGAIAATQVAHSTDGHTFTLVNNTLLTTAKMLNPSLGYEPSKDLAPLSMVAASPLALVVSKEAAGTSARQWLTWLRSMGDRASYGTPGIGTVGHLGMELVKMRSGLLAVAVPYKGNPEIVTAILSGQVHCALLPPSLIAEQVKAGKMHVIGIAAEKRSQLAPTMPTLREAGVFADVELWAALAGPSNMPSYVRERITQASLSLLTNPDIRARLLKAGWEPDPKTAEALKVQMDHELNTYGGIIIMRGIKAA